MSFSDDMGRFAGQRAFVTGHTGFKGAWLSLWLTRLGASVTGYSLEPPSDPNLFAAAGLAGELDHVHGDLRDSGRLGAAMATCRPRYVFHLAAQPLVRESQLSPLATFDVNVMGTVQVLEAVRQCPSVRAVIVVTSDKCYENREMPSGYREDDAMGGKDPYSASKGCAELVTAAYARTFFPAADYGRKHETALATVRAGNVIGGGDWGAYRLVPDCIRAFGRGQPVVLRNPRAIRPWQHVLDPLAGYLRLAACLDREGPVFGSAWNFGPAPESMVTVEKLVRRLAALWGDGELAVDASTAFPEAGLLLLDVHKARLRLGHSPRLNFEDALAATVLWYRAHAEGADTASLRRLCQDQMDRFYPLG